MSKLLFFIIMLVILLSVLEIMHIRANFFFFLFKEGAKDYLDSFKLKTKKGEDEDAK